MRMNAFRQSEPVCACEELVEIKPAMERSQRPCRLAFGAFEKKRYLNIKNIGGLLKATSPHSVHALLVFLNLLE